MNDKLCFQLTAQQSIFGKQSLEGGLSWKRGSFFFELVPLDSAWA